MKRIKNRAFFAIVIAFAIIAGICLFIFRLWGNGRDWAMMGANQSVYSNGTLNVGTLTDRNGVVLASASGGIYRYADDETVRKSCLHAVGDYSGFIGTGALSVFDWRLAGYDFVNGTNSLDGNGATVELTIDSDLNAVAYNALAGRKGAVMMMNYETGEILCMVSTPAFDPNYETDLSGSQYEGAYLNRCISSSYVPGSVFKIVTLAAAIENIPDLYERSFHCDGSVIVGGEKITCTGNHGDQTIEQAFANSCNCAFSEITQLLGPDVLAEYADKLGMTGSFDINGIETAAGKFEKAENGSGSLSWSGIGQSTDLVTPVAMMRLAAGVANGGTVMEPKLLTKGGAEKTRLISEETAIKISDMMNYNVAYAYGESSFPNVKMHAKTGTAEVGDGTSHAWFVGFIDSGAEPLAFAVIVENAGGGLVNAGPIANKLIQAAIE